MHVQFAAKEPAEWLEELQTFLPGAVELKVVPGVPCSLNLPSAAQPFSYMYWMSILTKQCWDR